jgi:glycosyltransferase involved in cell wall biosynthesis
LISVCIAAYNAEKYLEPALRSVAAQTCPNWEMIVTEDGSHDRTEAFVKALADTVPQRVTYNRHKTNQGLPAARNTGIAAASGEWVAFLDADDLWKPDHLESLISASQIEESDLVFSGSILHDDATWTKLGLRAPTEADLANLPVALFSGHLSIMPSAVMIKRDSLRKYGLISNEFPFCNDTEYWLRILSRGGHLCYSGTNTSIYRQHAAAMSRKTVPFLTDSARICERYRSWKAIPRALARSRPASLYRLAGRSQLVEDPAAALVSLSRSLRLQPLNPKTIGLWTKAFWNRNFRRKPAKVSAPGLLR